MNRAKILQSHEYIFQTYNELKRVLPNGFLKMKVLRKQKYPLNESTIINEIEKNYNNKNLGKNFFSPSQNINIFYGDEELPIINTKLTDPIYTNVTKTNSQKNYTNTNNLNISSEIITYRNFREKNMKMIGVNCDVKLKRTKGLYNSVSVNDIDMKKNIYLPRLIDRMKYNMPRNMRNNKGFIIVGNKDDNIINKYKELNFIKKKNDVPTDFFFYNEKNKIKNKENKLGNMNNKNNQNKNVENPIIKAIKITENNKNVNEENIKNDSI